ncbi:MAG: hypothetical protein FWB76_03925 [Oscillospiraceae bacterium]|nr:hypothetical protein [Oscillospiraceae bacterium]
MKKALIILMAAVLAVVMFACAANGNGETVYPTTPEIDVEVTQPQGGPVDVGLHLAILSGEFEPTHDFDISAHSDIDFAELWPDVLLVQTQQTLYNLAVVFLSNDVEHEQIVFNIEETFPITDALTADESLAIHYFVSMGTLPWNGIIFDDANGHTHVYAIDQNQSDYGPLYSLAPVPLARGCC